MSYADFTYYQSTYLGTLIASADFAQLALRASAVIDKITFQRAAVVVTANEDADLIALIRMATCAVAETIQTVQQSGDVGAIQSETVGQHSVTYADGSIALMTVAQKYEDTARLYLEDTGLMFRGFASGEYGDDLDDDE